MLSCSRVSCCWLSDAADDCAELYNATRKHRRNCTAVLTLLGLNCFPESSWQASTLMAVLRGAAFDNSICCLHAVPAACRQHCCWLIAVVPTQWYHQHSAVLLRVVAVWSFS